jgi:hypothetical protein
MVFAPTTSTELKTAVDGFYNSTIFPGDTVPAGQGSGTYGAMSTWDVSQVTNMSNMFAGQITFNEPIGSWVVQQVTTFFNMFNGATSFNQDLSGWNFASGPDPTTTMKSMFEGATSYNQSMYNWDVSGVSNFASMFEGATAFYQPLYLWDVSNSDDFESMFKGAQIYDFDLRPWRNQNGGPKASADFTNMFQGMTDFIASYGPSGDNLPYFPPGPEYTPTALFWDVGNTCFPAGTVISLDQGDVEIQHIDVSTHTINGERILAISRVTPDSKHVVRVEKDAFAPNCPSQTFECSRAHELISPSGERQTAEKWVNNKQITFVKNTHWDLYNVVLKHHGTMKVYNLEVDTLNPVRASAYAAIARQSISGNPVATNNTDKITQEN